MQTWLISQMQFKTVECGDGWSNDLPVPVAALAQISLPSKAIGIVLACIGVGLTNPRELTACRTQCGKYYVTNAIGDPYSKQTRYIVGQAYKYL